MPNVRRLGLLAVTSIGWASFVGCSGVSRDPLADFGGRGGASAISGGAGMDAAGAGGGRGGKGGAPGADGGVTAGKGGTPGGEGGVMGGEGGALGGEGGVMGGEGGAPGGSDGSGGDTGGKGGSGTPGGEGGGAGEVVAAGGGDGAAAGSGGVVGGSGGVVGGSAGVVGGSAGVVGGSAGVVGGSGGVTGGDGGATGGGAGDAEGGSGGQVLRRCSSNGPFGPPKRVRGLPFNAARLRLNADETVGYFVRRDFDGIWTATRPTRHDDFGEARLVSVIGDYQSGPTVTPDGLWLYFEDELPSQFPNIFRSAWNAEEQTFGPPELVPGLRVAGDTRTYGDYEPYLTASGAALYFHSNRTWPYEQIYRAARSGDTFLDPELVPVPGSRGHVVVSPDELTLYYTRNVSGGLYTADIWQVTRQSTSSSFTDEQVVEGPNEGQYNEIASFISEDGCRLYFDRNYTSLEQNSYVVERMPDLE